MRRLYQLTPTSFSSAAANSPLRLAGLLCLSLFVGSGLIGCSQKSYTDPPENDGNAASVADEPATDSGQSVAPETPVTPALPTNPETIATPFQTIQDNDNDGIDDALDNCLGISNPAQLDEDKNGKGDVCDQIVANKVAIPVSFEPVATTSPTAVQQEIPADDTQQEEEGEEEVPQPEPDSDGDGVADSKDNCPVLSNISQNDHDNDGKGDACDPLTRAGFVAGQYGVRKLNSLTTPNFLNQLVTQGKLASPDPDLAGNLAQYDLRPSGTMGTKGLACDFAKSVCYFSDGNYDIRMVDLKSGITKHIAGYGTNLKPGAQDGVGKNAFFKAPDGIALSPDAKYLYVADTGNANIRRITLETKTVQRFAGRSMPGPYGWAGLPTNSFNPFSNPQGITTSNDGTIYITEYGNRDVRRIRVDDQGNFVSGDLVYSDDQTCSNQPAGDQYHYPWGVAADGNDNLYVADLSKRVVWHVNLKTGETKAVVGHLCVFGWPTAENANFIPGTDMYLVRPLGLTIDPVSRRLYISDRWHMIWETILPPDPSADNSTHNYPTRQLTGFYKFNMGLEDGSFDTARFWLPAHMAVDPQTQTLYVAETTNNTIRKLDLKARTVSTLVGWKGHPGSLANGNGLESKFYFPQSMDFIDDHHLLVADTVNCQIRQVTLAPTFGETTTDTNGQIKFDNAVTTSTLFGKTATCGTGVVNSTATKPDEIYRPGKMTTDKKQFAYVFEEILKTLHRIDLANPSQKTFVAGTPKSLKSVDGTGAASSFSNVTGMLYLPHATDTALDTLYVSQDHSIRKIALGETHFGEVTTIAGNEASPGYTDGPMAQARFWGISSLTHLQKNGVDYLYVAETGNQTVRQINLGTGEVQTVAGNGLQESWDGIGTKAAFFNPVGITAVNNPQDGVAHLYVSEAGTAKIRLISLDTGMVSTIAGSGEFADIDGSGSQASFTSPFHLLYNPVLNRIFILDRITYTIRTLGPDLPAP